MADFDVQILRLGRGELALRAAPTKPRRKQQAPFLAGPVPWEWLCLAGGCPGRAIHVALALRFLQGIHKQARLTLSTKVLRDLGVRRDALRRALFHLERAGLVSVERHSGRHAVVTVREIGHERRD